MVALPHLVAPGFLERAFVACFGLFANLVWQVWDLERPGSRAFVGVGAFNLVRRDAYDSVGGHTALAFEVVDDAKLGLILRRSGIPQGALDSGGLVTVRWQQGFVASLNGLIKNAFAALEWSVPRTVGFALALVAMTAGPAPVGSATALPAWRCRRPSCPRRIRPAVARRATSGSGVEGAMLPLSGPLLAAVALASAASALWRQGIVWRGTFYPLADLRRGCVREATGRGHGPWAGRPLRSSSASFLTLEGCTRRPTLFGVSDPA